MGGCVCVCDATVGIGLGLRKYEKYAKIILTN